MTSIAIEKDRRPYVQVLRKLAAASEAPQKNQKYYKTALNAFRTRISNVFGARAVPWKCEPESSHAPEPTASGVL